MKRDPHNRAALLLPFRFLESPSAGFRVSPFDLRLPRISLGLLFFLAALSGEMPAGVSPLYDHPAKTVFQDRADAGRIFKSYFESKGFRTGEILIPELNTGVMLEENQFYKREENVPDVHERINEIRKEFGLPTPQEDSAQGYGWCGILEASCSREKAYGYIVLIGKDLNDASMIYTRAHENGHFLWSIGQQGIIYQKFKRPNFVRSNIQTEEEFANLCGWTALKIAGYKLEECFIMNTENPEAEINLVRLRNLVGNYLAD